MGIVVECCGLPGSGKSTLARAIVARLRLVGIPAADVMAPLGPDAARLARLWRKLGAVGRGLFEPGSLALTVEVAARSRQADRRDRIARPANLLVVRHATRVAARRDGVGVLDQGPLQEWWSAALRGDRDRMLAAAAADPSTPPDLLVRVDAPLDLLVERLGRRAERQSRLEASDPLRLREELEDGLAVLDTLWSERVSSSRMPRPETIRVMALDSGALDSVVEPIRRLGLGEQ